MSSNEVRAYLAKIAHMYYLDNMGQPEIARRMNVSVATVSRALGKARETGIVRITLDTTFERMSELELALEKKWGLSECAIVATGERPDSVYREMALVISEMLNRLIHRGATIGVSWGETLKAVGENLPLVRGRDLRVIPIIGAMGMVDTGIYPNSIAREFATRLHGTPYLVNIPAVVDDSSIRDSMLRDSHYRAVREVWSNLDIALVGVSGLDERTSAFRQGIFSLEELESLRRRGGVCATNFTVLQESGTPLDDPIADRILGLPFIELDAVQHVIMVATGKHKASPLRAALESGVITRLVTDEACATHLV